MRRYECQKRTIDARYYVIWDHINDAISLNKDGEQIKVMISNFLLTTEDKQDMKSLQILCIEMNTEWFEQIAYDNTIQEYITSTRL